MGMPKLMLKHFFIDLAPGVHHSLLAAACIADIRKNTSCNTLRCHTQEVHQQLRDSNFESQIWKKTGIQRYLIQWQNDGKDGKVAKIQII